MANNEQDGSPSPAVDGNATLVKPTASTTENLGDSL